MRGLECPGVVRDISICLYVWEKDPRDGLWPDMTREEKTASMIKSVCVCVGMCVCVSVFMSAHVCIYRSQSTTFGYFLQLYELWDPWCTGLYLLSHLASQHLCFVETGPFTGLNTTN